MASYHQAQRQYDSQHDVYGEEADLRSQLVTEAISEFVNNNEAVIAAWDSLDDYESLDVALLRAYRERNGSIFTDRLFQLLDARIRGCAEAYVATNEGRFFRGHDPVTVESLYQGRRIGAQP